MKRFIRLTLLFLLLTSLFAVGGRSPSLAGEETRVMVEFAPGSGRAVRGVLQRAGGEIHYEFDRLNTIAVSLPAAALPGIQRNPNVLSVEVDAPRYVMTQDSQVIPWSTERVQALGAHDRGITGEGVVVCIVDSGLYAEHEDFAGANIIGGYPDGEWNRDLCGHGTHVAGTIAAQDNAVGVLGVSPGASLYISKVFGDDCIWQRIYASTLVAATNKCYDAGADIISMSLGGSKPNKAEERQFTWLWAQGLLSVAAAGNDHPIEVYSYPASYDSVVSVAATDRYNAVAGFSQRNEQVELAAPGVSVPSTVPFLSTATVTVNDDTRSGYGVEFAALGFAEGFLADGELCTSTGDWTGQVVLCKRGEISFYEKVMNVQNSGGVAVVIYNNLEEDLFATLGPGNSSVIPAIALTESDGEALLPYVGDHAAVENTSIIPASGYEAWAGTSMATPHVSAVAALIWSYDPSLTNADVRAVMGASALDLGSPGRDVDTGYGLVQADAALDFLGAPPVKAPIELTAFGYTRGAHAYANLLWSGAESSKVTVYRDGTAIATTQNDGAYTDNLGKVSGVSVTYKICQANSPSVCSNEVTVSF
jgi:serine protease